MKINNKEYTIIVESTNYYGGKTVIAKKLSNNLYCVFGSTETGHLIFIKENIKTFSEAKEIFYKYEG